MLPHCPNPSNPSLFTQALQGKPITIYGDGHQTRSFQYVDDLVAGLIKVSRVRGAISRVGVGLTSGPHMEPHARFWG